MPNKTYIIPSRFYPPHSLLGRVIRALSVDRRQAQTTYVVAIVLLFVLLLFVHILLEPTAALVAVDVAAAVLALVGRQRSVRVSVDAREVEVVRDGDAVVIPLEEITSFERVDATTFHRHYARYARTRAFVNRTQDELLLLRWTGDPVVLGLDCRDLEDVERILRGQPASSRVDAA